MATTKRRSTPVWLSQEELQDLQALAATLGYTQPTGPGKAAGLGSLSAMLRGIQGGELIVALREGKQSRADFEERDGKRILPSL